MSQQKINQPLKSSTTRKRRSSSLATGFIGYAKRPPMSLQFEKAVTQLAYKFLGMSIK